MFSRFLKNSDKYFWTEHAKFKMKFYGLSPQRVLRVIRAPERIEEGIVEKTIAVMQPASVRHRRTSAGKPASPTWSSEIWAMYQTRKARNSKSEINQSSAFPFPDKSGNSSRPQRLSVAMAGAAKPSFFQNSIPPRRDKILNSANQQIRIISAWRYPGMSPKNNPIPEEILREIGEVI